MGRILDDLKADLEILYKELEEKKGLLVVYQKASGKVEREIGLKRKQIKQEENRIANMKSESAIHITDHAIVRYLERAMGLDVESFRKQILAGELGAAVRCFESGKFPIKGVNGSVKAVVENGTIITFQ